MKLVLLPGMDGTGELFAPLLQSLGGQLETQVIRYPTELSRYADLAAFVTELLPRGEPFVLLGESFSGPVAITLAARRPPGLVGLVLCCTFARCPVRRMPGLGALASRVPFELAPAMVGEALLLGRFANAGLRSALSAALAQTPADTLRQRLLAVVGCDVTDLLARIAVPVHYLQASQDRLVPASAAAHIARHVPGLRPTQMVAPHFLLQVAPEAAAREVLAFARSVAAA